MSVPCIFLPDENSQGCLVERARRFREHRPDLRPWEKNPCDNCKTGRDRVEVAGPPKEEDVAKPDPKESILAAIARRQPCVSTPILQSVRVKAGDLHQFTKELAAEGKIKIWTDGRKTIFTLPGTPNPFTGGLGKKPAALSNDATVPSKKPRSVNRKSTSPPIKSRAKAERPMPSPRRPDSNGNAIAVAIAEIEARRTIALDAVEKIDAALTCLRALA